MTPHNPNDLKCKKNISHLVVYFEGIFIQNFSDITIFYQRSGNQDVASQLPRHLLAAQSTRQVIALDTTSPIALSASVMHTR